MQHEGMTLLVLEATVDDGTAQLYLLVEGILPLLVGKLVTVHQIDGLTIVEHRYQGSWDA